VSGLSRAHEGLRIAFVTDVHHSEFVSQADVARAVDLVLAEHADLIVLGGDYVTNFDNRYLGPCIDVLTRLTAPHGILAIAGNHDDERATAAAFARVGVPLLRDARTTLSIRGEPLDIIGIRFWTRSAADIARLMRGSTGTQLLLAHDPRRFAQAVDLAIPGMLAGHTHGGQVVIPGLGAIAARRFPVLAGSASQEDTSMFVSRGVGTVYVPIRVNCPPDVAIVTLRARRPAVRRTRQRARGSI
jgi:predicted MPP superfamily phosphohydrolase